MLVFHGMSNMNNDALRKLCWLVYILAAAGIFTGWIATLVALVIAHVKSGDASGTLFHSHLRNVKRTIWIGTLVFFVGVILSWFLVGIPIMFAAVIWYIYRTVKGMLFLIEERPYPGL